MANTSMLQVRTDPVDREKAAEILNSLGTNLSAVVNMLLKQIIITESIPFEIKLHSSSVHNQAGHRGAPCDSGNGRHESYRRRNSDADRLQ